MGPPRTSRKQGGTGVTQGWCHPQHPGVGWGGFPSGNVGASTEGSHGVTATTAVPCCPWEQEGTNSGMGVMGICSPQGTARPPQPPSVAPPGPTGGAQCPQTLHGTRPCPLSPPWGVPAAALCLPGHAALPIPAAPSRWPLSRGTFQEMSPRAGAGTTGQPDQRPSVCPCPEDRPWDEQRPPPAVPPAPIPCGSATPGVHPAVSPARGHSHVQPRQPRQDPAVDPGTPSALLVSPVPPRR